MTNTTVPRTALERMRQTQTDAHDSVIAVMAHNARVELLGMADLIDDMYVWLTTITGTPESSILDEAREIMRRYKTRHAEVKR